MRIACLVVLLTSSWASSGVAQVRPTSLRETLEIAVQRGWVIRANLDTVHVEGRVLAVNEVEATVARSRVDLSAVTSVDRRSHRGGAAFVGAVFGALALGAISYSFASDPDSGGTKGLLPALGGAGAGAGLGMLLGSVADPGKIVWSRIWSARP